MALETEEASKMVVDDQQPPSLVVEGVDDKNKSPRHPRWTRQETLTLIEGKKIAENRGRRGRRSSSVFGSDQIEPKWDSVASYCKQHAVNRGPVQCRKRWSNIVGDFKKIKAWESQVKHESDSYWVMRNDLRKENKLPGFFDREVFDVLDGKAVTMAAYKLALVTVSSDTKDENEVVVVAEEEEEDDMNAAVEPDVVFDSGRHATSDDGLFQDSDKLEEDENGNGDDDDPTKIHDPMPISEKRYQPYHLEYTQGTTKEPQTNAASRKQCMSQEGCKRRRVSTNEDHDKNFDDRLIDVLTNSTNMLNARLEADNINSQLDRDKRKDYNDSLISALNKISEALTKIVDKL
uniref:trihelix transcription factor ASR3-like isoform X2 n=1 Tax=Erigeron canadensis TaxID=72917 RepID=UPI001CB95CD7|nr:trihelix transcription factor ASR3-like isoform X2 [Erigeron canadensis]